MRKRVWLVTTVLASIAAWSLAGCMTSPGGGGKKSARVVVPFTLSEGLGEFEAQAGVPVENRGTGSFEVGGGTISRGTLAIDPSVITVTPAPEKAIASPAETSTLIITAWIASIEESDTVCGGGEEYGPFNVTLDADNVPIAVDPASIDLTDNTIELISGGEFSLCIRVESPIDATIRIVSLDFDLR